MKSSFVSFDFIEKLLNFENVSPANNEIASLMDTIVCHDEPSEATTSFPTLLDFSSVLKFNDKVTKLETDLEEMKQVDQYAQAISSIPAIVDRYINNKLGEAIHKVTQSHNAECREEAPVEKQEYIDLVDSLVRTIIREEVKTQLPQILSKASTYEAAASLSEYELTKIILDKMVESKSHLRADYKRELYDALVKSYNTDKYLFETYGEVFTRKSSKEAELQKDLRSKEGKSSSSSKDTSHSHHKSSGKFAHAKELSHTVDDSRVQKNQEFDTGNNDEKPNDEAALKNDCATTRAKKPPTSFDELMDTPIDFSAYVMNWLNITNLTQELLDYFITNDLEYLKEESLSRQYSTSVTKTKAATYEIKWIEDMVPNLWSPVNVEYDKHAYWVTRLKIMKRCDYGHLDEIEVHERYDLNVALRMFTRRIVIQRRVEDLQLGVESYQKKLNLTKPDTFRQDLRKRTTYTAYSNPRGVIYVDQNNKNLMCTDEIHKFSDGTLNSVQTALHDITLGIRMEYLPKKKWSRLDKQRARVMIHNVDKLLFERRLMRNLEKFVGRREYRNDLRLLEQTI
ncbi:hypothetical protein Tco_0454297 [Tanacetum coccineum]